jgi:hypothetical protein
MLRVRLSFLLLALSGLSLCLGQVGNLSAAVTQLSPCVVCILSPIFGFGWLTSKLHLVDLPHVCHCRLALPTHEYHLFLYRRTIKQQFTSLRGEVMSHQGSTG